MKNRKGLKITGCVLAAVLLFFIVINVIPPLANVEDRKSVV